jgi:excinuclease ABC subunit A
MRGVYNERFMSSKYIVIRGAAEHNLKRIDLTLPRDRLIVVTGVSGSGKSSLAFDTLYAEGQRRYVESLSAYARQFLERMEKPDVELIEGLSPAISIEQKTTSRNPRSTVGTVTEIYDYMRLLYARVGKPHCPECGRPIAAQTVQQIVDAILEKGARGRLTLLAPIVRGRKGEYRKELRDAARKGFVRARVDGQLCELSEEIVLDKQKKHTIEIVVDRLGIRPELRGRLTDSVETALRLSTGLVTASLTPDPGGQPDDTLFSETLACTECGVSVPEMAPRAFSFNSPYGACADCDGLGVKREFDKTKVVVDPGRSILDGALAIVGTATQSFYRSMFRTLFSSFRVKPETPWRKLPAEFRKIVLHGSGKREFRFKWEGERSQYHFRRPFEGLIPNMKRRYREIGEGEDSRREEFESLMTSRPCETCGGARLRRESLAVTIGGRNIAAVSSMTIREALATFSSLKLTHREEIVARQVLKEIRDRLAFLENVGLSYLALDRSAVTLSGGEGQRIRLATQIGSRLTGVLYILDEPSIGLHQRDNRRLLDTLCSMRDLGNTVIVIEHDEETIRSADHVVDLGPGAGELGGEVVTQGTPAEVAANPDSLTGRYLAGLERIDVPDRRRAGNGDHLVVEGASEHNLCDITVRFPLGVFTCVTGVSGSGKSTLVNEILFRAVARALYSSHEEPGRHRAIHGIDKIDKVIDIDQSPIGRTPRSNPATYVGLFSPIRDLFALVPEARARGYRPGRFSFNVKGGRCEACQGGGMNRIEMHFLPDVYVTCDSCKGRRYNRETLEILYKGKCIADVLEMTVHQALEFFTAIPQVARKLRTLYDVGLGYIRLGQSATTLSGGEAQRIKLSRELSKVETGRTLYVLDEPTTGLHFDDIKKLLAVLSRLTDQGNTVIVIEHNLEVIKSADWIIDLGPEGGEAGGLVVASGPPEKVARARRSRTGQFLRKALAPEPSPAGKRRTGSPPRRVSRAGSGAGRRLSAARRS